MQRAEREPVRLDVRSVGLHPLDMRSLEVHDLAAEPQVVPADTAAVLVGEKDALPE